MSHFSDQFIAACDAWTSDDDYFDRIDGVDSRPRYPVAAPTTVKTFEKSITYDRITHDFRATLDGQLIGYFPNKPAAQVELDRVAFDWLTHGYDRTATDLDGAQAESAL